MDAFGGVGGNVIQFGKICKHSIGVEIDESKSLMCQNNIDIYGVNDTVTRVVSDYLKVTKEMVLPHKVDAIFMSPPWGGTGYKHL